MHGSKGVEGEATRRGEVGVACKQGCKKEGWKREGWKREGWKREGCKWKRKGNIPSAVSKSRMRKLPAERGSGSNNSIFDDIVLVQQPIHLIWARHEVIRPLGIRPLEDGGVG